MKNTVLLVNKHITNTKGICLYITLRTKIMEKNLENILGNMNTEIWFPDRRSEGIAKIIFTG